MLSVYGPNGQRMDNGQSEQVINTSPVCTHPNVITVEDNSGIEGVVAKQCQECHIGWLIREKINER